MASIRQQITLEPAESEALRATLGNRQIDPVLAEIRAAFNSPAQPESPEGEKRSTLVTRLRAGHELTEELLHDTRAAIRSRTQLLTAVVELLGEQAPQAQQLLDVHRHAETVVDSIAASVAGEPRPPSPSPAPEPAGHL